MKTILASLLVCLGATAGVAPKDWLPSARDAENYHRPPAVRIQLYRDTSPSRVTTIELPPDAALEETPEVLTFAWDASKATPSNSVAAGYLLWMAPSSGGAPVLLLGTGGLTAQVPFSAGVYYISATNQFGASALSLGLAVPKPTTNILSFSSSLTNWPALSWTNKATAAMKQYFTVKYAPANRASVVFSPDLNAPFNTWQDFTVWPAITTTNRNIQLFWRLTVL